MPDDHIPKQSLFGWLDKPRPQGGPRKRWKDVIRKDLKSLAIPEEEWYEATLSRESWHRMYGQEMDERQQSLAQAQGQVQCSVCGRYFRRECDRVRHKCTAERQRPVCEQSGAVQCPTCSHWFRSKGGLAVHRCVTEQISGSSLTTTTMVARGPRASSQVQGPLQCQHCSRWFRRQNDISRHKCITERALPVEQQRGSMQCRVCGRWFLSRGGMAVHRCVAPDTNS